MNAWTIAQFVVFVTGMLLAYLGDRYSHPILFYGGISLFGMTAFLIGAEAIVKRRIVLGRRRYNQTYVGIAAIAQGFQFMFIAAFFIGVSIYAYFDAGRDLFLQFVRRPWPVLLTIGFYCLMQSMIAFSGYEEEKQGERWIVTLNLLTSRVLPGVILVVMGLGIMALGLLDLTAPAVFDRLGGGFLEVLYGVG